MVHPVPEGGLVRAYIISGAYGLMVIDPGSVGTAEAVMTVIRGMCGRSLAEVRGIVATHFHFDHIGGMGIMTVHPRPRTMEDSSGGLP